MLASFLTSNGTAYFNSFEIRVPESGQICGRLRRAWTSVASKYEILRTGFANVDDTQHPFAMLTYRKGVIDVGFGVKEESPGGRNHLHEATKEMSETVLRSLHHPSWRIELLTRRDDTCAMRVFIHHALFDAHSIMLILRDVINSYHGEELSTATSINSLLKSIISESIGDREKKETFWTNSMGKPAVGTFPNTAPVEVRSSKIYSSERCCEMPLSEVKDRCRNIGVTIQAAGQASWARVLSSYIGEDSVIFGTGILDGNYERCLLTPC